MYTLVAYMVIPITPAIQWMSALAVQAIIV
jgi:hypothetical protein